MNHNTKDGKYEEGVCESMRFGSPYTPGAGAVPTYLAGRDELLENAEKSINALVKGYPQQSVVYYGLRGVGKTVLLNAIEEKADLLFDKILKDPEACERLMQTFYGEIDSDLELVGGYLPPEQFAKALFDAYKNRDLTAFLMAVCKNSMFDLLRNSFLAPFRFNADGQVNPYLLTDEDGNLIQTKEIHVSEKDYNRFKKVFRKEKGVKMYLAYGYRKRHSYDADTMDVMEYKMGEHIGLLLVYELPDTVKQQRTEAQAYAAVWDIMMKLQKDLPRSFVYYGQDSLEDEGQRFDELGVFLPIHRFSERLEKSIDTADKIVHAQA